jgi:SAM-dependent methyltransferase
MAITADLVKRVDVAALEEKVKAMYRDVALDPHGEFHFEMGRALAERLGYAPADLDAIPGEAIDSFAGVGYYFDLAALERARRSSTSQRLRDGQLRRRAQGRAGRCRDRHRMTDEQLAKAARAPRRVRERHLSQGHIESTGLPSGGCDAVISNADQPRARKGKVFREAARILKPGGRLALADIVTEVQLPQGITRDATLWAACIGGAMQVDDYVRAIESAGLRVTQVKDNPQYRFISTSAQGATRKYRVKSVSLVATRD